MQTTLLGLAVALILALVAALVGPHFVDWSRHRAAFETQASALLGAPVRISGPIKAQLLPVPSLALHSVETLAGQDAFSARMLRLELALGPLLRGDWRVSELVISEPQVRIRLDGAGRVRAPALPAGTDADLLAVERLAIENGRGVLADDASGATLTLENLSFEGAVRSLAGPVRGEGFFVSAGAPYRFRVATGRYGEQGVKLRLTVEAVERSVTGQLDGALRFKEGSPVYEGAVTLTRQPTVTLADGKTVAQAPWRAVAQVKADPARAEFDQIELQYGADDRPVRLSGKAAVALGAKPRLEAALSGRQVDLDRLFEGREAVRRSSAAGLALLRSMLGGRGAPVPGRLELDLDALTLAGAAWQNVHGRVAWDGEGIAIDRLEFRAPGLTQARLSGRLRSGGAGLEFTGPASIESSNAGAILALIDGRPEAPRAPIEALRASGEVVISESKVVVERLHAEIDRKPIEGRIAFVRGDGDRPPSLDAALRAAEVDLDGAMALAKGAFAGVGLNWPRTMTLALAIGKATYAGVGAERVEAKLKLDASGLHVERLSVADLRGAAIEASGRIDAISSSPRGALSLSLKAPRADGLFSLAGRFAPAADQIRRHAGQLGAADLRARLELAPAAHEAAAPGRRAEAKLALDGKLGAGRVQITASAIGDPAAPEAASVTFAGSLEADDGKMLATLAGLDRLFAIDARPVAFSLEGKGAPGGGVDFGLRATASGLLASAAGAARWDQGALHGDAKLSLSANDARALLDPGASQALPLTFESRLVFSDRAFAFEDLKGRVAGSALTGRLDLRLASPWAIGGRLETSDLDAARVLAVGVGAPSPPRDRAAAGWSGEPFAQAIFSSVEGRVSFEAARANLVAGLEARGLKGLASFSGAAFALEDVTGSLADGALTANAEFLRGPDGLSVRARLRLAKAELAQIAFGPGRRVATAGQAALSVELEGAGLSPGALIGSLRGNGTLTIENAQLPGLDPNAINAAVRAVDRGLPLERLPGYLGSALDAGRLTLPAATGAFAILGGRARFTPLVANAHGAEVAIAAALDFAAAEIEARLTLAATPREVVQGRHAEISVALSGPIAAPRRTVEAAALVSFLTLRAVEREAKRVEAAEREAKRRSEAGAAERERAATQRREERPPRERIQGEGRDAAAGGATGLVRPGGVGVSAPERAPGLPPPIEIRPPPAPRPRAASPPRPAQAPAPQNRTLWDDFFNRQ